MSNLASSSRRTRASIAAPAFATPSASASRTRNRDSPRRRSTATLSRPRRGLLQSDSSDLDNQDRSSTRRSSRPQHQLDEEADDAISEEDVDQEALDELLVLEQVTPRPNRRIRIDPVDLDTTQTALDRFRLREQRGDRMARASIAGPTVATTRPSTSTRSQASTRSRSRQSAPLTRTSDLQTSGSRSMHTTRSEISAAPTISRRSLRSNVSAVGFAEASEDESRTNTTMTRPGQRLRPSLAHPDGRLDVPTIEERCAALVINAKGVLHFYLNLYDEGWQPGSFEDMLRNWSPFESYKTNQLLAEAQYMHHFIDIEEVTRSLRASGQPRPDGFDEAMRMANCATFVHYIHQLPTDPAQYGRSNGHSITGADVVRAPLRNISELSDARRIFLRWILPFDWELTDEVLNMLLDMSIQIFIHRLERIVEAVRAGEMAEDVGRSTVSDHLIDLTSGDVVRHSLQRVKKQRGMSRAEIERMVQRYETFANVRQIDLQSMFYDYDAMRESFSFQSMSADLTGYVRDVVREVDAGMHSTTLPLIMDRLARESSVFSASDVPDVPPGSSSVIDGRNDDSSSVIAPPSQSTPKAAMRVTRPSQPFASQYANWLDEMLDEDEAQGEPQPSRLAGTSREQFSDVDLTETQRLRELDAMLMETATDQSVDLNIASSPPRAYRLGSRLSAALNSSGRTSTRNPPQQSDLGEPSETSDAIGIAEPQGNRDGPFDSPAKEKASRLGFDSQNRLVRRTSDSNRKNQRLLDGSAAAVRESRFDSQGEEEEDVFLDNAVRSGKRPRRKGKGKAKAVDPPADLEAAAQATPRPRRNLRSNAVQRRPSPPEEPAEDSDADPSDVSERQTARRKGSRSAARQLQLKQESVSPAKRQAQQIADQVAATEEQTRVTRSQSARNATVDGGATGLGRGVPEGGDARSQARILSTASGRLHEDRESSDDDRNEVDSRPAGDRVEGVQAELGATRATPNENFIGDDDQAVLDRRAALDAALAAKKPRPGTLHFYRPEADDDAVPLGRFEEPSDGENVDAIAMRNGDAVAEILRSSNAAPSRRIGPYRPENGRRRAQREEADPTVDRYTSEVDELEDEAAADEPGSTHRRRRTNTHAEPSGQSVRVEPYKRSNLYITGHNMTGRTRWTQPETDCLLDSLHELARYKKIAPKFKVYTEILRRHGVHGTQSRVLARWNNVQLKDKSRNELIRMKREG
ncbi:hypothetical protein, partial [Sporisorium scitamineum]